jgi:hypothetical protein
MGGSRKFTDFTPTLCYTANQRCANCDADVEIRPDHLASWTFVMVSKCNKFPYC